MKNILLLTMLFLSNPLLPSREPTKRLICAIYANNTSKALKALSYGADVNFCNALGETPLILAIKFKANQTIINALLSYFPDLNQATLLGDTALHAAARAPNHELCKRLLSQRADPHTANIYGETPRSIAKTTPTIKRIFKRFKQQDTTSIYQIPEPEDTDEKPSPHNKRLCIKMGDELLVQHDFRQRTAVQASDPTQCISYGYQSPSDFSPLVNPSIFEID